ncbi:hypothetical protein B0H13DRAFT_2366134 [Mycena leptocephala]|nr:hypothetical protein B0H13DRAFT_2366134 [Mycena leptocephala]
MTAPSCFIVCKLPPVENVYDFVVCRLRRTSAPFQAWNSGLRDISQVGCDIVTRLSVVILRGVALHPPLHRSRNSIPQFPVDAFEFIPQSHRCDVFANVRCQSLPTYLWPISISLLSVSAPNSLLIRARFDSLTAPTSLPRCPSPLCSWISLASSRSRSVHRGVSCAEPLIHNRSDIPARALVACEPTTSCLIPACGRADDAQLGMLCALAFLCSPRSLRSRGGRFFGLAPLLFACAGVGLLRNECKLFSSCASGSAARPLHAFETAAPATSLPARISHAYLAHLVRLATVVDGDGETEKRAAVMGMQMEMEYGPRPRPRTRLPPCPRPERAPTPVSTWWYSMHSLQAAPVCARCEELLSLTVVFVIPSSCAAGAVHTRYARDVDIEAGVYMSSCDRGVAVFDTEGARSADLGIILGEHAHSHAIEVGTPMANRGCVLEARTFCLPPPVHSLLYLSPVSLSFSSNSVGSLFCTI